MTVAALELRWITPGSSKVARTLTVLARSEHLGLFDLDVNEQLEATAKLTAIVRERTTAANRILGATTLRPLVRCAIERKGPVGTPTKIKCGLFTAELRADTLTWQTPDRSGVVKSGWSMPPIIVPDEPPHEMVEAVLEAHYDAPTRVLTAIVYSICKVSPSDACASGPVWRTLALP
jgi:hypothetical protein